MANYDRAAHVPQGYSHVRQIAVSLGLSTTILTAALVLASRAALVDLLLFPIFFLVGNAIEWAFHQVPMHSPTVWGRALYEGHTLNHHRAFPHGAMPICNTQEFSLVLMPAYTIIILMVLASPVAILAGILRGSGAAGLFYVFAVLYFMHYEILHGLFHQPDAVLHHLGLGNNRLFQFMKDHHTHHHRLDRMNRANFNVSLPVFDFLMGTREKAGEKAEEKAEEEAEHDDEAMRKETRQRSP